MLHFNLPGHPGDDPQRSYENAEALVEKALGAALPFPDESPINVKREWVRLDYVLASNLLTNLAVVVKDDATGTKYVFGVNRHTHVAQLVSKH